MTEHIITVSPEEAEALNVKPAEQPPSPVIVQLSRGIAMNLAANTGMLPTLRNRALMYSSLRIIAQLSLGRA